jgi:hypothetical protein
MLAEVRTLHPRPKPLLAVLTLLLLAALARAQTATPSDDTRLQTALARAAAAESALRSSIPSFACQEDVLSEELEGKKSKITRRVTFTATVRVERRADHDLHETFEPASWADILAQSRGIGIPFYVSGGFQHALDYFDPARSACYRFALHGNRLDFAEAPEALHNPACKDETGLAGFALLDRNDDVVHLERRVPDDVSRRTSLAPFAAIDFAPTVLNGQTYRLSSHVVSDSRPGPTRGHFEATYTGCKLFRTTVTIEPNATPIPNDAPPPR